MRTVTADFKGAEFPPGTKVSFVYKDRVREGIVTKLLLRQARVMIQNKTTYKVSYYALRSLEPTKETVSLVDIEKEANDLLKKHNLDSWEFKFDLAENRGGCCYYFKKVICLSVSYCAKATKSEITNTLLHEIAHALVGPGHNHNHVWQRKAQSIGCNGYRCHQVIHTPPKYVGSCACAGFVWKRQRLTRKAQTGYCGSCGQNVNWKLNTDF